MPGSWLDAQVIPGVGLAYKDMFTIVSPGWVDVDLPLLYTFECHAVVDEAAAAVVVVLRDLRPTPGPFDKPMAVEGLPAHSHRVVVKVTVQDSLRAEATSETNITALPPATAAAREALSEVLVGTSAQVLKNGDVDTALVMVDATLGLLNVAALAEDANDGGAENASRPPAEDFGLTPPTEVVHEAYPAKHFLDGGLTP
ncbi:hypothetical protein CYMTET_52799 [Cymbomonas tetramitiformis]|uniref:PKD/REJ-like domain-containing protein n=1 Tax=Cymbomonas tetramitiformis TaxID=36881 RepID=A0AAE0BJE5_9CHLO|nr:hypothetical protein CYMTET_52799 [Cymbomonas tetramitiformis]